MEEYKKCKQKWFEKAEKLEQENKQLKETVVRLKEFADAFEGKAHNLKQKLEKIEKRKNWLEKYGWNVFSDQYINAVVGELKEILSTNKDAQEEEKN